MEPIGANSSQLPRHLATPPCGLPSARKTTGRGQPASPPLAGGQVAGLPALLTVKQVAQILQWNPYTVVKKAEKGDLPGFKLAREWRFRQEDLVAWIEHQRNRKQGKAS